MYNCLQVLLVDLSLKKIQHKNKTVNFRMGTAQINSRTSEHSEVELSIPECPGVGSEEITTCCSQQHEILTKRINVLILVQYRLKCRAFKSWKSQLQMICPTPKQIFGISPCFAKGYDMLLALKYLIFCLPIRFIRMYTSINQFIYRNIEWKICL